MQDLLCRTDFEAFGVLGVMYVVIRLSTPALVLFTLSRHSR